jgi:hypothetical protein
MLAAFVFFITAVVGLQMKRNFCGMLLMLFFMCGKNFMNFGGSMSELLIHLALT